MSLPKPERKDLQVTHAAHASHPACFIKYADKIANLRALAISPPADWPPERSDQYIAWSAKVIGPIQQQNPQWQGNPGLESACAQLLKKAR